MSDSPVSLVRLSVVAPARDEEILTAVFLREDAAARATGLVVEDADVGVLATAEQRLLPDQIRLSIYVPGVEAEAVAATLEARLATLVEMELIDEAPALTRCVVRTEDWQNRWRDFFHVTQVSERVVVRPPWREYSPAPGEVVVNIEPGLAFGTGGHQTTQLCLRQLDRILADTPTAPARVIDVGCGSGVLAVSAVLLGAGEAHAVDVDPPAWEATRDNAAANGVADRVLVREESLEELARSERYPIVLANIISGTLLELREALVQLAAPGGVLILSGLLVDEREDFARAFAGDDGRLALVAEEQLDEWLALVFRREEARP